MLLTWLFSTLELLADTPETADAAVSVSLDTFAPRVSSGAVVWSRVSEVVSVATGDVAFVVVALLAACSCSAGSAWSAEALVLEFRISTPPTGGALVVVMFSPEVPLLVVVAGCPEVVAFSAEGVIFSSVVVVAGCPEVVAFSAEGVAFSSVVVVAGCPEVVAFSAEGVAFSSVVVVAGCPEVVAFSAEGVAFSSVVVVAGCPEVVAFSAEGVTFSSVVVVAGCPEVVAFSADGVTFSGFSANVLLSNAGPPEEDSAG